MTTCPCGSTHSYSDCCGRFIEGTQVPQTPEELMRSRYTAYTQTNMDYIVQTMKEPAANEFDTESSREWAEKSTWLGLDIVKVKTDDDIGWVEFIAKFAIDKETHILHELSEFRRDDGVWFYIDGEEPEKAQPVKVNRIGRNDPCHCGSKKKYKKCCGNT